MDKQQPLNIISAYAPQNGCTNAEKSQIWEDFDDLINQIKPNELIYIGGDLNDHVGASHQSYSDVHGGFGYGSVNKQGEEVLEFGVRHFSIVNNFLTKKRLNL